MTKQQTTEKSPADENFYSGERYVIEESIGYLIKQAQLALHRTIESKMAELDLTAMQWSPLTLLWLGKGKTAAELSRCLGVETSTMTRMLDRLEAKGLLSRRRCVNDRRIIWVELTEEGRQIAAKIPYLIAESLNQHLQGFSQQELDTLKSLLRRFAANSAN
ncbi:MAG TPA: MarR family transcriptional regulator [Methylophilaceae bacterium]|nr:MarR family transcriptional regulator [Methylophilaceae bacterium]